MNNEFATVAIRLDSRWLTPPASGESKTEGKLSVTDFNKYPCPVLDEDKPSVEILKTLNASNIRIAPTFDSFNGHDCLRNTPTLVACTLLAEIPRSALRDFVQQRESNSKTPLIAIEGNLPLNTKPSYPFTLPRSIETGFIERPSILHLRGKKGNKGRALWRSLLSK